MATTQTAGQLLQVLLTQLEGDAVADAAGLLQTFFTNIAATPTEINVAAQAAILVASLPLQLPKLSAQAIGQIAATGQAIVALLLASIASSSTT